MKHTHLVPVAALLLVVPTFAQQSTMPDPQMKAVLDQLTSLGGKPIESLARGSAPAADTRRPRGKGEPRTYDGVTHEFFGMAVVVDKAREAQQLAAANLIEALAK